MNSAVLQIQNLINKFARKHCLESKAELFPLQKNLVCYIHCFQCSRHFLRSRWFRLLTRFYEMDDSWNCFIILLRVIQHSQKSTLKTSCSCHTAIPGPTGSVQMGDMGFPASSTLRREKHPPPKFTPRQRNHSEGLSVHFIVVRRSRAQTAVRVKSLTLQPSACNPSGNHCSNNCHPFFDVREILFLPARPVLAMHSDCPKSTTMLLQKHSSETSV